MLDNLMGIIMSIKATDVLDMAIVAFLLYKLLEFIKDTRALQLFRGILLIVGTFILSEILNLSLLNWLLTGLVTVGLIAVVILFQPEIRRALEQIGRRGVLRGQFRDLGKEELYATVHKLVDAVDDFSSTRTGALIAIERETMLNDIIETGVIVDAEISVRLLGNLFYEGSPLHDGAVIIRGKLPSHTLAKHTPLGGHIHAACPCGITGLILKYCAVAIVDGRCHHQHTASTTVRRVIHSPMLVLGVIPDIPDLNGYSSRTLRPADNALVEHSANEIRKKSHYIKSFHISQTFLLWE